jgi:hypothetical protein
MPKLRRQNDDHPPNIINEPIKMKKRKEPHQSLDGFLMQKFKELGLEVEKPKPQKTKSRN